MVTVLKILSDEVMMEVFEYLDAYNIYRAFFKLNSRFNRLLKDNQLYLKFNFKHVNYNHIIDGEMWQTMIKHLTAVTLINDRHIRMLMSSFIETL